jgi:Mn-dependent DtxR family transcriptional regulator
LDVTKYGGIELKNQKNKKMVKMVRRYLPKRRFSIHSIALRLNSKHMGYPSDENRLYCCRWFHKYTRCIWLFLLKNVSGKETCDV